MTLIRVLKSAPETLTHTFYVGETPTSASGSVTVTIKRLDGTIVETGPATLGTPGKYTFAKAPYADLDTHVVEWAGAFPVVVVKEFDFVEIVGGFHFDLVAMRTRKPPLDPIYTTVDLAEARLEAERECERICRRAFVPRFARFKLNGAGTNSIVLPDLDPVRVRALSVAVHGGATFATVTGSALASCIAVPGGVLVRDDGNIFPDGHQNVLVEYEYGTDVTPDDLRRASMRRARNLLKTETSTVPDRAISFSTGDGTVYRLTTPSGEKTGLPDVDGIYEGYRWDGGFA